MIKRAKYRINWYVDATSTHGKFYETNFKRAKKTARAIVKDNLFEGNYGNYVIDKLCEGKTLPYIEYFSEYIRR